MASITTNCKIVSPLRSLFCLAILAIVFCAPAESQQEEAKAAAISVKIDWNKTESAVKTNLSLQVVVNPPLRRDSPIHDRAWNALRELKADYVRFVPWYPYPRLGVAELEPPTKEKTSWEFSLIDPLVEDFFQATDGRPVMLNFSTIPQWMFRTANPVKYPDDPNEASWSYEQGEELRDPSGKEVADYYSRVASWYARGGFTDELGAFHASQHKRKIALWEVLNEPEYEHAFTPQDYTKLYDAVVAAVRKQLPETQFVGMSLAEPSNSPAFFEYFLDARNHKPGTPLDWISYHFYAVPTLDQTSAAHQFTFFDQADKFLTSVKFIEAIRKRLSPQTKTAINEVGCILPQDIGQGPTITSAAMIPQAYWNLCGAMFAYLYVNLARQGIDVLSSSQLVGYPTQFPTVSMLDWQTGKANARYSVLQLLHEKFRLGDHCVTTEAKSSSVLAQAFVAADGKRKILLINKRDRSLRIMIPGSRKGSESHVDIKTSNGISVPVQIQSEELELGPFSVAVLELR